MEHSVGRKVRVECRGSSNKEHCWHPSSQSYIMSDIPQQPEICCRCLPRYLRINILVNSITEHLEEIMNNHPIYNFQAVSAIAVPDTNGNKLLLPRA